MKDICIMHDERCPGMSTFACPRGLWFPVFTHHSGGGNLHSRAESPSHHGPPPASKHWIASAHWPDPYNLHGWYLVFRNFFDLLFEIQIVARKSDLSNWGLQLSLVLKHFTQTSTKQHLFIFIYGYTSRKAMAMATDRCNCSVTIVQEPGCCPCPSCESRNNPMSMWKAPSSSHSGLRRHWIGDCGGWTLHDCDW